MIEFLKPNKSKTKLGILIFFLIFLFYSFQVITRPVFNHYTSQEYQELLKSDKYSTLRQSLENFKPITFEGNEVSSISIKYILVDALLSFLVSIVLAYLGACTIFRLWNLGNAFHGSQKGSTG